MSLSKASAFFSVRQMSGGDEFQALLKDGGAKAEEAQVHKPSTTDYVRAAASQKRRVSFGIGGAGNMMRPGSQDPRFP